MKPTLLCASLLIAAALAYAQSSYSSHSGWNFTDTLENATSVLVGDLIGGTSTDNGSQVKVQAQVRVVRVVQGEIAQGTEIAVEWQYQPAPFEGPAVTAKVPKVRGLWFLRKKTDLVYEALMAQMMPGVMGGFFTNVPTAPPPGALAYGPDDPRQTKVACEMAWALVDLVTNHSADFGPHRPEAPVGGVIAGWVRTRNEYQGLTMSLGALDTRSSKAAYAYLSTLPDPTLKLLGIGGRLGGGDTNAVFELERDIERLASTYDAVSFSRYFMSMELRKNIPATHAIGRIALGETTIPGLDGLFAMQVSSTRNVEFTPYLAAMLRSPEPSTRGGALMGFCQLLGPTEDGGANPLWKPAMQGYCVNSVPMNDREQEQRSVRFWTEWFEQNREELQRMANLPRVAAPARYNVEAPTMEIVEVPVEVRFQSLLGLMQSRAEHYHSDTGAFVDGPPPGSDNPAGLRLSVEDLKTLKKITDAVNDRLTQQRNRSMEVLNAARLWGAMPDHSKMVELEDERQAILKAGLSELKAGLTGEGWQVVEGFMQGMVIRGHLTAPK